MDEQQLANPLRINQPQPNQNQPIMSSELKKQHKSYFKLNAPTPKNLLIQFMKNELSQDQQNQKQIKLNDIQIKIQQIKRQLQISKNEKDLALAKLKSYQPLLQALHQPVTSILKTIKSKQMAVAQINQQLAFEETLIQSITRQYARIKHKKAMTQGQKQDILQKINLKFKISSQKAYIKYYEGLDESRENFQRRNNKILEMCQNDERQCNIQKQIDKDKNQQINKIEEKTIQMKEKLNCLSEQLSKQMAYLYDLKQKYQSNEIKDPILLLQIQDKTERIRIIQATCKVKRRLLGQKYGKGNYRMIQNRQKKYDQNKQLFKSKRKLFLSIKLDEEQQMIQQINEQLRQIKNKNIQICEQQQNKAILALYHCFLLGWQHRNQKDFDFSQTSFYNKTSLESQQWWVQKLKKQKAALEQSIFKSKSNSCWQSQLQKHYLVMQQIDKDRYLNLKNQINKLQNDLQGLKTTKTNVTQQMFQYQDELTQRSASQSFY